MLSVFAPATTVVGSPTPTSSACDGPHITATSAQGISCSTTSEIVIRVSSSIPFATQTIICPSVTYAAMLLAVLLVNTDGTARTRNSFPVTASFKSVVNRTSSGSFTPGSLSICSCSLRSMATSSSTIDHTVTSFPLVRRSFASAMPQLPAPITPTFAISFISFFRSEFVLCSIHQTNNIRTVSPNCHAGETCTQYVKLDPAGSADL